MVEPHVGYQTEPASGFGVLRGNESLGRGRDIKEGDTQSDGRAEFGGEGAEGNAAVYDAFKIWPDGLEIGGGFATASVGLRANRLGQWQEPAGQPGEEADVARDRALRDGPQFRRPIGQMGDGCAEFIELVLDLAG
jgi:hypothetical protein